MEPEGNICLALEGKFSTPESNWSWSGCVAKVRVRGEGAVGKEETGGPSGRHEGYRLVMGAWRGRGRAVMEDQTETSGMDLWGDAGSFSKFQAP